MLSSLGIKESKAPGFMKPRALDSLILRLESKPLPQKNFDIVKIGPMDPRSK